MTSWGSFDPAPPTGRWVLLSSSPLLPVEWHLTPLDIVGGCCETTFPKFNIEPEKWYPGIGDSFWKPSFFGSMLNLGSVAVVVWWGKKIPWRVFFLGGKNLQILYIPLFFVVVWHSNKGKIVEPLSNSKKKSCNVGPLEVGSGPIYHSSPLGVEFFAAVQVSHFGCSEWTCRIVWMFWLQRGIQWRNTSKIPRWTWICIHIYIYTYIYICMCFILYIYIYRVYIYIYTYIIFILFRCNCTYLRYFLNHHLKIGFQPTCIWFCRHELLWRRPFCRLAFWAGFFRVPLRGSLEILKKNVLRRSGFFI